MSVCIELPVLPTTGFINLNSIKRASKPSFFFFFFCPRGERPAERKEITSKAILRLHKKIMLKLFCKKRSLRSGFKKKSSKHYFKTLPLK